MGRKAKRIARVFSVLLKYYGHQEWWPTVTASPQLEIALGAILTQNTSWRNVEKAMSKLDSAGLVDAGRLRSVSNRKLGEVIRSSGYYNQKAERLKAFCSHLKGYHDDFSLLAAQDTAIIRQELLSIKGIGQETADSILLYSLGKPVFVIDAYTRRIFSRIGICSGDESYTELQQLFEDSLPKKASMFNQYHALIVQHAKAICQKKPKCEICPLRRMCRYAKRAD